MNIYKSVILFLCLAVVMGCQSRSRQPVRASSICLMKLEFLNYVLPEGQESVKESGLCQLNNVYIRSALESLQ